MVKKNLKLCDRSDYEKKQEKDCRLFRVGTLVSLQVKCFWLLIRERDFLTPKCDSCNRMMSKRNGRNSYRCHKCSKKRSAFKGTFFSNCRIPLSTALFLVWAWCGQLTWLQVYQFTGLSKDTCTKWWVYLRELVTQLVRQTDNRIGGEGKVVQIDESKFGKRKKRRVVAVIGWKALGYSAVSKKERENYMETTKPSLWLLKTERQRLFCLLS